MVINSIYPQIEFVKLWDEYKTTVQRFCVYKLNSYPERAEDCLQETFVVLYKVLKSGEKIIYPKTFLLKSANNFIKIQYKSINKQNEMTIQMPHEVIEQFAGYVEDRYFNEQFDDRVIVIINEQILKQLTSYERLLIDDVGEKQLKLKDIAEKNGIKENSVQQQMFRLRNKIRKLVKDLNLDDY